MNLKLIAPLDVLIYVSLLSPVIYRCLYSCLIKFIYYRPRTSVASTDDGECSTWNNGDPNTCSLYD